MSDWGDLPKLRADLQAALDEFDWEEAAAVCRVLADRIVATAAPFPAADARDVLYQLRRKRRFADMKRLAEALLLSDAGEAQVERHLAQALIDGGELRAARGVLERLLGDPATPMKEQVEAAGLLGRLYKQMYVDARRPDDARQRENLGKALGFYLARYEADPVANTWHGINAVALLARARRDRVDVAAELRRDERAVATAVLAAAEAAGDVWSLPTRLEACVALDRWKDAADLAGVYAADLATFDAFEIASTRRQLEQVWELSSASAPGGPMMDELRAAEARRVGGAVTVSRDNVGAVRQANFDDEGRVTRKWWKTALDRSASVARIETRGGRKVGTGFLVDPAAFFDGAPVAGPVLLTNWHVISEEGKEPGSIAPEDAVANFEGVDGPTVDVGAIVGSSSALDACFVSLKEPVAGANGCPLRPPPIRFDRQKRQRVYVIGYPAGDHLSFSIHDSVWLGMDATTFHYRTPTEPGSSGSPVFDEDGWRVVALHRAGGSRVPRLSGVGTYEANVGVAIEAIRQAVAANRFG